MAATGPTGRVHRLLLAPCRGSIKGREEPGTGAGGGAAGIPPWPPAAALLLGLLAAAAAGRLPRLRRR